MCINPNGCEDDSHYGSCIGCYWWRDSSEENDNKENDKDAK